MVKDEVRELLNIGKTGGIDFCVKCALSRMGWALEEGCEEKYLCPSTGKKWGRGMERPRRHFAESGMWI